MYSNGRSVTFGKAYPSRLQFLVVSVVLLALVVVPSPALFASGSFAIVTPSNLVGWAPANVRTNGAVSISAAQPRGTAPYNRGSLEFTTNTITSGLDKADYQNGWGNVAGRTLGNLSNLKYEFYRDGSSTTAAHFAPVLRLYYQTANNETGLLIWEQVYNGYQASVPTNTWITADLSSGYFWMRAFGPGRTIERFDVTLAQWNSGLVIPNAHVLGPDTKIIGMDVGVGSGWGATFRGFVDNIEMSFGADQVTANFEPNPACTTVCYVDDSGSDAHGGTSASDALQTIQAAINRVTAGGEVRVAPGTYLGRFTVDKPVKLLGAQAGILAKNRSGEESIIRLDGTVSQEIVLAADNITVDGFTFNAQGFGQPWIITAIHEPGDGRFAGLNIRSNMFTGNPGVNVFPGGMYLLTSNDLIIEQNYFNDLGQHAVFLGNQSTGAVYRNNDSFGNYNSNFSAHVGPHTTMLVENNRAEDDSLILFNVDDATIRGNSFDGNPTTSSRVYIGGGSSTVTVADNTFTDVRSTAISIFDAGFNYGGNSDVTITGNVVNTTVDNLSGKNVILNLNNTTGSGVISGNRLTFTGTLPSTVPVFYGIAAGAPLTSLTISNNEVVSSVVLGNDLVPASGMLVRTNTASGALPVGANVAVNNNTVTGWTHGVTLFDSAAGSFGVPPAGVSLSVGQNSLGGNAVGLASGNAVIFDSEKNWWGDKTGPTSVNNPGGTGAAVQGAADITPWLCSGQDTDAAQVGFQPNTSLLCNDNIAPVITVPADIVVKATSSAGAVVTYQASATDNLDGPITPTCVLASGSVFAPGSTTVTCTATDAAGNTSSKTFKVTVNFDHSGFFQPIDMNGVINTARRGSVVPVKFEVFGANGIEITNTSVVKSITFKGSSACSTATISDEIETYAVGSTALRYDATAGQFIYNWKTPSTPGCYSLIMTTTDGQSITAVFNIK